MDNNNKIILEEFNLFDNEIAFMNNGRTAFITNKDTALAMCGILKCSLGELSSKVVRPEDIIKYGVPKTNTTKECAAKPAECSAQTTNDNANVTTITPENILFTLEKAFEPYVVKDLCRQDIDIHNYPTSAAIAVIDSTGRLFPSFAAAENFYGLSKGTVSAIVNGRTKVTSKKDLGVISFNDIFDRQFRYYIYKIIASSNNYGLPTNELIRQLIRHLMNRKHAAMHKVAEYCKKYNARPATTKFVYLLS